MEELTYEQDGLLREILKGRLDEVNAIDKPSIIKVFDKLHETGLLKELFGVVLRPYNPTILHRAWNAFWSWKNTVPGNPIDVMKNSEIAGVVGDFFVVNLNWIDRWKKSDTELESLTTILPVSIQKMPIS